MRSPDFTGLGCRRLVVPVLVLALLAAGCGSSSSDVEPQTLEEFMGWDEFVESAAIDAFIATDAQIEAMTVECMAGKGLEYTAFPVTAIPDFWMASEQEDAGMSEAETLARRGYGFAALFLEEAAFAADHAEELAQDNPNWVFAEAAPEGVDYWEEAWACQEQASIDVRGEPKPELHDALGRAWEALEPDLEGLRQAVEGDSRLDEAEEAWSACLASQGYGFESPDELEASLASEFGSVMERLESEYGAVHDRIVEGTLPDEAMAELEALAGEELAMAAADASCRVDLEAAREVVRADHGGRFIAEHRVALEAIRELEHEVMERRLAGQEN